MRESSKVKQVIFFSAPTSIPNRKALAQIRFEISCIQDFQNLFSKGHYSNKGHNTYMKKIQANYFFHEESVYEISKPYHSPFKGLKFHRKVEKSIKKIQNSVFLSKFDGKFSKVNQVIYFSAPTSVPNMKALASILLEISCTQDFQILFSKGHNSNQRTNGPVNAHLRSVVRIYQ